MPPVRFRFHSRSFCTTRQLSSGSQLARSFRDWESSHSDCPCFVTESWNIHANRVEWCMGICSSIIIFFFLRKPLTIFDPFWSSESWFAFGCGPWAFTRIHRCLLSTPRWTRREKQFQAHSVGTSKIVWMCEWICKHSVQHCLEFPHFASAISEAARDVQFSKAYNILCLLARSSQAQHILESTEEHHHLHVKQNQTHKEVNLGQLHILILYSISWYSTVLLVDCVTILQPHQTILAGKVTKGIDPVPIIWFLCAGVYRLTFKIVLRGEKQMGPQIYLRPASLDWSQANSTCDWCWVKKGIGMEMIGGVQGNSCNIAVIAFN